MTPVGQLIGAGRSADIYEHGEGRVLRRSRSDPISAVEVSVMRSVHAAGYPVPAVHSVDGCDMEMDRIDGIDLLTSLTQRPWRARKVGFMLADLHQQLAAIALDGSDLKPASGPAEAFVHGDLHPGNVLLTTAGPVVIDWESAGVGARDADVATTWLLLDTAEADDVPLMLRPFVGIIRAVVLRAFLSRVPVPRSETVAAVCEGRLRDPNMRPIELARIRAFAANH